jgi:hypothetical protein
MKTPTVIELPASRKPVVADVRERVQPHTTPIVTELLPRLEPVTSDPFIVAIDGSHMASIPEPSERPAPRPSR